LREAPGKISLRSRRKPTAWEDDFLPTLATA
jgi:hypothetical protein